jgi:biopolymer transport protein TolR
MAMTSGSRGGPSWQINMTPMIDVLLVLLIIFMVIQPTLQKGIEVQIPPVEEQTEQAAPDQITLEIRRGPAYLINGADVPGNELRAQIRSIFADRERKVLFVNGAEDIVYGDVVNAVDAARGAGIEVVGLVPRAR